jgi:hypothetical protein
MTDKRKELYRSANGDVWYLVREGSGRICVEHEPNSPSGGRASRQDIGQFLARGAAGPEHQALLHLIGLMIDDSSDVQPPVKSV